MNRKATWAVAGFAVLVCWSLAGPVRAGFIFVPGGGGGFSVPVASVKERKFAGTKRQQYDFSCGSAAVATLLSYHYKDPVEETTVFNEMFEAGDKEKIKKDGFSLLDMKRYLKSRGYRADGFKVPLEKFVAAGVPGISLLNEGGYRHFVVVKGMRNDKILVGDPFRGTRVISRSDYEQMTDNLIFVIKNKKEIAQAHFNEESEWRRVTAAAPSDQVIETGSVSRFTLLLPMIHDF